MTRLIIRGLLTRKLRTALTSIAILLGVAMISGTFVLTDQINGAFNDIFDKGARGVDAVVQPTSAISSSVGSGQDLFLPASLVDRVKDVPGVARAEGTVAAVGYSIVKGGKLYTSNGGAPSLVYSHTSFSASTTIQQGHYPSARGEIAVDRDLAARAHVRVGDHVGMATAHGVRPVAIAGVFKYAASIGGATIVLTTLPDAQAWFDAPGRVSSISVAAASGTSPDTLVSRIRPLLSAGEQVKTGTQDARDQAKEINDAIGGFLTPALLAFAGVSVLVGAFIIFNTFSITVAQRLREFAMLRTLGASRRQVLRSVIGEALVVSLTASVLGILGGFGFGALILWIFRLFGVGIPTAGVSLPLRGVVLSLLVGVGITLLAAFIPALRATRIPPVAALREGATIPPGRFARYTPVLGAVLAVLGLLLLINGFKGSGSVGTRLLGMALGAVLIFVAVAMLARYVIGPLARAIGWPIERVAATTGRLARDNARRNPSRTAITSAALMIGVGFAVFMAVFAHGLKESFLQAIDRSVQGDVIVSSRSDVNLPAGVLATARATPGVGVATALQETDLKVVGGGTETSAGIDPATFGRLIRIEWQDGTSNADLARLGTDGALLNKDFAHDRNLSSGQTFSVVSPEGKRATFKVLGTYKDQQGLFDRFMITQGAMGGLTTKRRYGVVFAKAAPGTTPKAMQSALERRLQQFPGANVQSNAEFRKQASDNVNVLLILLSGLLSLAIVISLVGMVNTLVLSIFERTREIGMMRAIGLTRWQLRRMVGFESIITAVIGGILGVVVGLFFGYVMAKGLENEGIVFSVPYGQLVIFLILAVAAGLLAALFPARRAAKLRPLEALHYE